MVLVGYIVIVIILSVATVAVAELSRGPQSVATSTVGTGGLDLSITDPLLASQGVSAVYLSYSNEALHRVGDSSRELTYLNESGTVRLESLSNLSVTVAAASIPVGLYDSVELMVQASVVEFDGQNLTAVLGSPIVNASIPDALSIGETGTAYCLLDISSVVLETGAGSSPAFELVMSGTTLAAPASSMDISATSLGSHVSIAAEPWWQSYLSSQASLTVTNATLRNSSVAITIKNSGQMPDDILVVTLIGPASSGSTGLLPFGLAGETVFQVGPSGSLMVEGSSSTGLVLQGYELEGGASVTLTYTGALAPAALETSSISVVGFQASAYAVATSG